MENIKIQKVMSILALVILIGAVGNSIRIFGDVAFSMKVLSPMFPAFSYILIGVFGMVILMFKNGQVDLSMGAVLVLSGYLFAVFYVDKSLSFIVAVVMTLIISAIIGLINGIIVKITKVPSFIITLVTGLGITQVVKVVNNQKSIVINKEAMNLYGYNFGFEFDDVVGILPYIVVGIIIAVYVLVTIIENRDEKRNVQLLSVIELVLILLTSIIFAYAMASMKGVHNVILVIICLLIYTGFAFRLIVKKEGSWNVFPFINASIMAAIAGICHVLRLGVFMPQMRNDYLIYILIAALVGGGSIFGFRGSAKGGLVGGLFVAVVLNTAMLMGVGYESQRVIMIALLISAVLYNVFVYILFEKKRYDKTFILGFELSRIKKRTNETEY